MTQCVSLAVEEEYANEESWPGPLGSAYATEADLDFRAEEPPECPEDSLHYQLGTAKNSSTNDNKPTTQASLCRQVCKMRAEQHILTYSLLLNLLQLQAFKSQSSSQRLRSSCIKALIYHQLQGLLLAHSRMDVSAQTRDKACKCHVLSSACNWEKAKTQTLY